MAKSYPYEEKIKDFFHNGTEVTIDRRGAAPLKGELDELEDDGFHLVSVKGAETKSRTYIAYIDVCGVTEEVQNFD